MRPHSDSSWSRIALIAFFLLILGYGYYEARGLLFGPSITAPSGVTTVHEQYVMIEGKADRIVSLAMNGKEITVTEEGAFKEPYLLAPGDNRIVLDAKDKYGHVTSRTIEMMYVPEASSATSSPPEPHSTTTSQ